MSTRRQRIVELLREQPFTVRALAHELGLGINALVDDLRHIRRSQGKALRVSPSCCEACGQQIRRDDRFIAPSRCPRCKSERTSEPEIWIR